MYPQTLSPYIQQNNPYYQYQQPYQRLSPIEQNSQTMSAQPINFLKGRPVTSMEEARVAQIDFDGTLNIFTDIANKKIYTKQINLDGTSSFNVYCLTEIEPEQSKADYVTREEYNKLLSQFEELVLIINNSKQQSVQSNAAAPQQETNISMPASALKNF